jgi:hypothetical protein
MTSANNALITNNEESISWEINTNLQDITIPFAYFDRTDFFQAIKKMMELGQTTAYVSRTNVLKLGADLS